MDYAAVAGSVVLGNPGVRACLVLSPDGLPLAVHPANEEEAAVAVWSRLSALGQVSRGFVTVRSEVWAFVQGERYGALVLADRTVRPGQLLDLVDQVLAEAASASVVAGGADRRLEGSAGQPERVAARRFRMPLHPDEREPEVRPTTPAKISSEAAIASVASAPPEPRGAPPVAGTPTATPTVAGTPTVAREADPTDKRVEATPVATDRPEDATVEPASSEGRARAEVDIIALAREFAALLSERPDGPA